CNVQLYPIEPKGPTTALAFYRTVEFIWWQAVAGIIGAKLSNALCNNSRCTWRYREGARNVYNTAIRRVLSPLRLCGSVTADVHGCPRGVAPIRRPLAIRDNPVAHTGGATTPWPHHSTGCDAHPSVLFSPPGHGFPHAGCSLETIDMTVY